MILVALFTTFITTSVVMAVYKPAKRVKKIGYKHRTIERKIANSQLRVLAYFHSSRNIPSIINLMESSRGTAKNGGLCVYALHLKELSERSSAILMVQKARRNGLPFWNKGQRSDANHVVVAFEAFQQLSQVSVRPMISISSLSNMHEDICTTAEKKMVAIIVLPFYKHQRLDGSLETTRADFRLVNRRVLQHASCSVGILVDRGLGGNSHVSGSNVCYSITVLFFGGYDDREALSYGLQMSEHPGIRLRVVHFSVEPEIAGDIVSVNADHHDGNKVVSADEEFVVNCRKGTLEYKSVTYEEKTVRSVEETVAIIRDHARCNLILVGRAPDGEVALALNERSECPELGPIGNLLISPDFSTTASVLVVQQYQGKTFQQTNLEINEESSPDGDSGSSD